MLSIFAPTASLLPTAPSPSVVTVPRARDLRALESTPLWRDEEDWALLDAAPEFTVGAGNTAVTFWTALASSSAVLCERSSSECAERAEVLATQRNLTLSCGPEPEVLDSWSRLPGGRITGRLNSRTIWLTVAAEGRLASDPRSEPGYVEAVGGRVYELGVPAAGSIATAAVEATGGGRQPTGGGGPGGDELELERWGLFKGVVEKLQLSPQAKRSVPLLFSFALVGGLCFELGASGLLSPPPPPIRSTYPGRAAAERVSLTISEQRARQALRVAADQTRLEELRSEARSYEPGGLKSYERRRAVLQKRLETDRRADPARPDLIARDEDAVDNLAARMQGEKDAVQRRIASTELRLRQDEEALAELARVEKERGPGATAVQLGVFPSSSVDEVTARTIPSGMPRSR